MATRSDDRRITAHDGLLTFDDAPTIVERPGPGDRLRRALAELDERQGEETRKRAEERRGLAEDIRRLTEERNDLLRRAGELKDKVGELQGRLDQLPDEAAGRAQLVTDRLAALGRVMRADVHMVNDMLDDYAGYLRARREWDQELAAAPELADSIRLVEFHTATPDAVTELPEVLREIIESKLTEARASLTGRGEPVRPEALAPVYGCVAPNPGGGSVALVVIPGSCEAVRDGHPHAGFVAEVLAAMSHSLLEETDADAPVVVCPDGDDPLRGAIVVGAVCGTDALDADLFGVRLQELLADSHLVGVEVQPIEDPDLAGGLADIVRARAEAR